LIRDEEERRRSKRRKTGRTKASAYRGLHRRRKQEKSEKKEKNRVRGSLPRSVRSLTFPARANPALRKKKKKKERGGKRAFQLFKNVCKSDATALKSRLAKRIQPFAQLLGTPQNRELEGKIGGKQGGGEVKPESSIWSFRDGIGRS